MVTASYSDPAEVDNVLKPFSDAARDDRAVVLAAVEMDGYSLESASDMCKNDKEIVLATLAEVGEVLPC